MSQRLYNQTNRKLEWDVGGRKFTCAPFDAVDIPDDLVEPCLKRGLPFGYTPVAPQTKAKTVVQEEQEAARNDKIRLLNLDLDSVRAEANTAKQTAAHLQGELSQRDKTIADLSEALDEARNRVRVLEADKAGLDAQIKETAAALQHANDYIEKHKIAIVAAADGKTGKAKVTTGSGKAESDAGAGQKPG